MWSQKRRLFGDDFPDEFTVQHIGVGDAMAVSELQPDRIAAHFRKNPHAANDLLSESYDKRYNPSTFITEEGRGFRVGWFSSRSGYGYERRFSNLADAATDYLLFSLGKGRWAEPPNSN